MRMLRLGCVMALAALPALAADTLGLLFATPHLAALKPGDELAYDHRRQASSPELAGGGREELILLRLEGGEKPGVTVTLDAEGRARQLEPFRGTSGNPILMVFLESVVGATAKATGGSPFYLRNRVKEGLRERLSERPVTFPAATGPMAAREFRMQPFAGDAHLAELGAFAGLELRFVLAEAAPGMILLLAARTPEGAEPAYSEEIRLATHP
ncbi:MAG TPA: hypothetical protein VFR34_10205 [Paracoccaceae bacterium]|nr:hypothetical protein [Paracoccaceae bacterium]